MECKTCSMYNTEEHIKYFYKNFAEYKDCSTERVLKRYYDNKGKIL